MSKNKKDRPKTILCPRCGNAARERESKWGPRHDCCGLWSYNYTPLVPREVHWGRVQAHSAFDVIWKDMQLMSRRDAYRMLAEEMNLSKTQAHFSMMNLEQLEQIPMVARRIIARGLERRREQVRSDQESMGETEGVNG